VLQLGLDQRGELMGSRQCIRVGVGDARRWSRIGLYPRMDSRVSDATRCDRNP